MKREIVKIDREKCNGCGLCIPNCHEGALQMIDGKATLVSELMCDGLGACVGHCPEDAITIEIREAEAYDEVAVVKEMIPQGKNVLIAHFKHLKEHEEFEYLHQGVSYLKEHRNELPFKVEEVTSVVHASESQSKESHDSPFCGCPGSKEQRIEPKHPTVNHVNETVESELRQWPVQMHLINPSASYFKNSDLLLAADCVAYTIGDFHRKYLKGKSLCIACPKLDSNKESYVQKLIGLIDNARINTITVMIMEVPCCGGLLQLVNLATNNASRKVPVKALTVDLQGEIISEEWV